MVRDVRLNVYAVALPDFPRRVRIRGRLLTARVVEGPRGRAGAVAVIAERVTDAPPLSEDALREQHAVVMELWRRSDALLPARFGSVIAERDLEARVAAGAAALGRALRRVRGRVQMTVRVFGGTPTGDVPRGAAASGTAYLAELRDRASALAALAAEIRRPVHSLVVEERVEPGQGATRVSVFHLIEAADERRYRAAIEAALARTMQQSAAVTGPWPPFAFAPEL